MILRINADRICRDQDWQRSRQHCTDQLFEAVLSWCEEVFEARVGINL